VGAGVGDAMFSGALREVMRAKGVSIEDALVLRPFPQVGAPDQLPALWEAYRQEIISQSGIALFLFGNKEKDGKTVTADGLMREFEIARQQGISILPIGATGSAAKTLADQVVTDPDQYTPELDTSGRTQLASLAVHNDDLMSLIPQIVAVIRKLQGKA